MSAKPAPFSASEKASRMPEPHSWSKEKTSLMVAACREMALFHSGKSVELGALYKRRGFDPKSIRGERDLERIPPVMVTAMKRFLLTSLPHDRAFMKLTSSGTRGQKTQIWFDAPSLDRAQAMLASQWAQEGLVSATPANYLMFVYDPKEAKDLGIAFSDKNQQRFAPVARSFHAIKLGSGGAWEFRKGEVLEKLRDFAAEGLPVRLFGIPSFIFEFLSDLRDPIPLPKGSWMVTGGGWKAAEEKKVSREHFRGLASRLLGLPLENIRDGYGMAEHGAPYLECRRHRFHVPAYARIFIRNPVTLEALAPGERGLIELLTIFNAMMPNLAVLSTDLGFIDPAPCPCGHNSPTFTLAGRGGLKKHKGCAIHAGEIVKRS